MPPFRLFCSICILHPGAFGGCLLWFVLEYCVAFCWIVWGSSSLSSPPLVLRLSPSTSFFLAFLPPDGGRARGNWSAVYLSNARRDWIFFFFFFCLPPWQIATFNCERGIEGENVDCFFLLFLVKTWFSQFLFFFIRKIKVWALNCSNLIHSTITLDTIRPDLNTINLTPANKIPPFGNEESVYAKSVGLPLYRYQEITQWSPRVVNEIVLNYSSSEIADSYYGNHSSS